MRVVTVAICLLAACGSKKSAAPAAGSAGSAAPAAEITKWKAQVPALSDSVKKSADDLDRAFQAVAVLGAADPSVTVALLGPILNAPDDDKRYDRKKVADAEAKLGPDILPALIPAAKLPDQPGIRLLAFRLADAAHADQLRPLMIAQLKEKPFLERDSRGTMVDPRGFLVGDAVSGLEQLGPDPAAQEALLAAWQDERLWDGDRSSALDAFAKITPTPTPAQMQLLLQHAMTRDESAIQVYGLLAGSVDDIDKLAAVPPPNGPTSVDTKDIIAAGHEELACEHKTPCLTALVESVHDRQARDFVVRRAMHELSMHPDPTARPALLAALDETTDANVANELDLALPAMIVGACPECVGQIDELVKRHAADSSWSYPETQGRKTLLARSGGKTAPPAYAWPPAKLDSFVAVLAAEHAAFWNPSTMPLTKDVFAPAAFGYGVDASEVATTADALAQIANHDAAAAPKYKGVVKSYRHVRGHVMWDTEELIDESSFARLTQVVVEDGGAYHVRAWAMDRAIEDADLRGKKLSVPAAIPDVKGDADLDAFARTVFSSKQAFEAALSTDEQAFSWGNGLADEWPGDAARKAFEKMGGTFALHDGVHAEKVSDDVGFAAANVDFSHRTYRVIAVFVKDSGGWKIVQSNWSLGLPMQ